MKDIDIKKYIKKQSAQQITFGILVVLLFLLLLIYVILNINDLIVNRTIGIFLMGILMIFIFSINNIKKICTIVSIFYMPEKHKIFNEFKSANEINNIILDAINNHIYEDKLILITKNYLIYKKYYTSIIKLKETLAIYEYENNMVCGISYTIIRGVILVDKFGEEHRILYSNIPFYTSQKVQNLLNILTYLAPQALKGYSEETIEYINTNKVKS